jgi:hypothetical protein
MMRRINMCMLLVGCLLAVVVPARADWVPMGTTLNASTGNYGRNPAAAVQSNTVWVTYEDYQPSASYQVLVKRWNGVNWAQVGGLLNNSPSEYAEEPNITVNSSGTPYVIWEETPNFNIFVKRLNGASWQSLGGTLNYDPGSNGSQPGIAVDRQNGNLAYAVWVEGSYYVCYKRWNEGAGNWVEGNTLNVNIGLGVTDPSIALDNNNRPVVAWAESNTTDGYYDIHVKCLTTAPYTWTPMEGGLSLPSYPNGTQPKLVYDTSGGLYLGFTAFNGSASGYYFRVFNWNGTAWSPVGGVVNENLSIYAPSLASASGRLYAFYLYSVSSGPYQTVVKEWNAGTWNWVGLSFNRDSSHDSWSTALVVANGAPCAIWGEQIATAPVRLDVYANQWLIPGQPTPTPTPPGGLLPGESISAYPLPASTQVTFALATQETGQVVIKVYNTRFRQVKELTGSTTPSGQASLLWDVSSISPGIYFYHITINGRKFDARKLVIAR